MTVLFTFENVENVGQSLKQSLFVCLRGLDCCISIANKKLYIKLYINSYLNISTKDNVSINDKLLKLNHDLPSGGEKQNDSLFI